MDISQDLKLCQQILDEYKKMTPEDGQGAYKLSQLALTMLDRLNEIRIQVEKITIDEKKTKSELKEYLKSKMKVMDRIHIQSKSIYEAVVRDKNYKRA